MKNQIEVSSQKNTPAMIWGWMGIAGSEGRKPKAVRVRSGRARLVLAADRAQDLVHSRRDSAVHVSLLEAGHDLVADDPRTEHVGQGALQPVAHLDPHLPVVARDEQQHAVVLALLARLQLGGQADAVGLDRLAAQARDGVDHDLVRGLLLVPVEGGVRGSPPWPGTACPAPSTT